MLDLKFIRENPDQVKENCGNRLCPVDVDAFLALDRKKRELETRAGEARAERNAGSKTKPAPGTIEKMKSLGEEIKIIEAELAAVAKEHRELWLAIPNLTHPDVKISADENDNPVVDTYLEPKQFDFPARDHVELALKNDLIDFERAAKVSGAKFYYLKNELVALEFALIRYALDIAVKHGFTPFTTPDLARAEVLEGLGFNPRGESTQVYGVSGTDLSLIGTAEITMGGYHMDEVFAAAELPKKYVAVSHCFRTEAGTYSKYAKGIFRVHQFTKVEMFIYTRPEESEAAHAELLAVERVIFEGLKIPFRVVDHCTADLGAPAIRTFDLEAWLPGKPKTAGVKTTDRETGDWAEITSASNCTDYQARGLSIKYQDETGKKSYVHMLNGTAIAVTRAIIAIMENFQLADGRIAVPAALRTYMGGVEKIGPPR